MPVCRLIDVAKSLVFVTDLGEFATVNAVYAEAFGSHRPAIDGAGRRAAGRRAGRDRSVGVPPRIGRLRAMPGAIIILFVMFIAGPIGV